MDVTERLLSTKVVVFVGFLWFMMEFCKEIFDSLGKMRFFDVIFVGKSVEYFVHSLEKMYICESIKI